MPNVTSITSKHNKSLLDNRAKPNCTIPPCNCRNKANCPLEGRCRQSSIVYKVAITSGGAARRYYGCGEAELKARFYNHNHSCKYHHKSNSTELSKAVWRAKDAGKDPSIKRSIMAYPAPVHHTNPAQEPAASASQRGFTFFKRTPQQRSINDQNSTENVDTQ